jgi:hypothetical protein
MQSFGDHCVIDHNAYAVLGMPFEGKLRTWTFKRSPAPTSKNTVVCSKCPFHCQKNPHGFTRLQIFPRSPKPVRMRVKKCRCMARGRDFIKANDLSQNMNWSELAFSRTNGGTIMNFITAVQSNLLSPAVLFFVLGVFAAVSKSDLKFPESLYTTLTIYLLMAIGFKGGVAIHEAGLGVVWLPALAITFPFNITFGLPLFFEIAKRIQP